MLRLKPHPYGCYVVSFGTAFIVYLTGWSNLYPRLQPSVVGLLLCTSILFLILGRVVLKLNQIRFNKIESNERSILIITLIVYLGWAAEFIYEGGVPLLKILFGMPYDYKRFGIPSFHVLIVTFSSYYTLYILHAYLSRRRKLLLILYAAHLVAAVLIYSRAMLFFNLTGSFFLFLTYRDSVSLRQVAAIGMGCIVMFYLFGVLGSLRVSRIADQPYNNENFMATGGATEWFRDSMIPKEYFWAYIYISSPLANLQQNINLDPHEPTTARRILSMINAEILPDFISKRTTSFFRLPVYNDSRIPGPFNVSSIYSRSYSYAGWTGVFLMVVFLAAFPLFFRWILPVSSKFFLSGWCVLCTMYFFSVYDNTFRFTGLSFQLVYPVVLYWLDGRTRILSRVF